MHMLARFTGAVVLAGALAVITPATGRAEPAHAADSAPMAVADAGTAQRTGPPRERRRYHDWGRVVSGDHVLRQLRHKYRYHYVIKAPTRFWSAEIFLINPHGDGLASYAIDANSDPDHGNLKWTIHGANTTYGRHVMRMKITYCRDKACTGDKREGFVKPSSFRMLRPRR